MPRYVIGAALSVLTAALLAAAAPLSALAEDIPPPAETASAPLPETRPPIIVTADALPVGTRQIVTIYQGSWNGFSAVEIGVAATVTPSAYAVVANLSPEGLTELTSHLRKSTTYQARASGQMKDARDPAPAYYFHHGGKRGREVEVKFNAKGVTTRATPKFGDYGDPPATAAQKKEAMDALTAAVAMASATPDNVCNRTLKIFDGKARYDLALAPDGAQKISVPGYKGQTTKCEARYTRIAGYDKPKKKKDKPLVEKPFTIWFAPAANGLQIPARIRIDSNFGPISVTLQSMEATAVS